MTNLWELEPERPKTGFAQVFVEANLKVKGGDIYDPAMHDKNDPDTRDEFAQAAWPDGVRPYAEYKFTFAPLKGNSYDWTYRGFSEDWKKIVLPSLLNLVREKKLANAPDIHGKFVRFHYEPWRDYSDWAVDNADPNKLRADEKTGRLYAEKTAHLFEDVYATLEEMQAASDALYGVENRTNDAAATNGAGNANDDTAKYLPWIEIQVRKALRSDQKVDRDALASGLANDSVLANQFSINSPEVQELVRKVEAEAKPALVEDDIPF